MLYENIAVTAVFRNPLSMISNENIPKGNAIVREYRMRISKLMFQLVKQSVRTYKALEFRDKILNEYENSLTAATKNT